MVLAICISLNPGAAGHIENSMPPESHSARESVVNQTKWELVKSRNGISIFSQWVTLHDGYKTRRLRGEFRVNLPVAELLSILKDGSKIKNWMEGVSESYTIKDQENTWYSYAKFNIPWPFDDQDLVVENTLEHKESGDTVYIYLESMPDLVPYNPDLKRMENFYGYWKVVRISGDVSLVEYAAYSRSEPLVPRFIQDPVIQNTFLHSLDNLVTYCRTY